jgi:hypothetical protein
MIKKALCKIFSAGVLFIVEVMILAPAAIGEGCFTIVAGKDGSADGYVIMAHNEDDGPPQVVNYEPGFVGKVINKKVDLRRGVS